jgi:SNF2 family DNA or RNA helicase
VADTLALSDDAGSDRDADAGFEGLYPFQLEDVEKLSKQKAALIGNEQGTGKTHIAIEIDARWQEQLKEQLGSYQRTLVVAPLNTHDSWLEKYEAQLKGIKVFVIDRKKRELFAKAVREGKHDVYIIHWQGLLWMQKNAQFKGITFGVVIADEVHAISNQKAQQTRALKNLRTHRKLGLSGTASGDKPAGLWSVLNWLWPQYYTSFWRFVNHYCEVELKVVDEWVDEAGNTQTRGYRNITGVKNHESLHREMAPWYARHLKRERCCEHHPEGVMSWLKPKTYDTIWVDLLPAQRKVYDQMRKEMVAWVGEHEDTPLTASVVVAQLIRLSQMALAMPRIEERMVRQKVYERRSDNTFVRNEDGSKIWTGEYEDVLKTFVELEEPSTKIDALVEWLQDNPGPVVVFSSSKRMLYLVKEVLDKKGITSGVFSGDADDKERERLKREFGETFQVFLGVIEAIGEGVDGLQHKTDTAIFLDRSWRTIKNMQAEDRLHRGGQKDTVRIIDIMARNTVDLGRRTKLEEKWGFVKMILGDKFDNRRYVTHKAVT